MALIFKTGDMFEEPAEAIVNTVNCVGVMGKGVALEFKRRWPENFKAYKRLCDKHDLRPGKVYVHENTGMFHADGRKFLINFPTKDHWRAKSKIEFIEAGLDDFVEQVSRLKIRSVVLPPLGCGNGGLDWRDVKPLITEKLSRVTDVDFIVFVPEGEKDAIEAVRAPTVRMTFERAVLLKAFNDLAIHFDGSLTRITMQKLAYFLQELGVDFGLPFARNEYGPYSESLREAFIAMERQDLISGFVAGARQTTVTKEGLRRAEEFLSRNDLVRAEQLIAALSRLVEGYESPYGLELLSSVHFVANYEEIKGVDAIVDTLGNWSKRKSLEFDSKMVGVAIDRLTEDRLLN